MILQHFRTSTVKKGIWMIDAFKMWKTSLLATREKWGWMGEGEEEEGEDTDGLPTGYVLTIPV